MPDRPKLFRSAFHSGGPPWYLWSWMSKTWLGTNSTYRISDRWSNRNILWILRFHRINTIPQQINEVVSRQARFADSAWYAVAWLTPLVVIDVRLRFCGMFSKIPQRFSAPFGLLGDEAKLAFPSQPGGITKLFTVRVCRIFRLQHNSNHAVRISMRQTHIGIKWDSLSIIHRYDDNMVSAVLCAIRFGVWSILAHYASS